MKKIIFMGTPEFAVPTLKALINSGYEIVKVVTQPDRPKGRGKKLTAPPVKEIALAAGLSVFQPESLKANRDELNEVLKTECDFIVVVAFGQILPKELLDHPKEAPLNIHASLLPAYRGAAPIARAIIEGEQDSGVSIQWIVEELDMGDVLYQIPCKIEETDTAEDLHDRLSTSGSQALVHCLELFKSDKVIRKPQDPRIGSYASKLKKEESKISFQNSANVIHRQIMGMNPWPVAECQLAGERLRIFKSQFVARPADAESGTVIDVTDDMIVVACRDGCVGLEELQLDNRKKLPTREFLKGHHVPTGLILGGGT